MKYSSPGIGWCRAVLIALLACAGEALAGYDTFALGTGRDGALTVSTAGRVVNRYTPVTSALAAGDTAIAVASSGGFSAGDLVMVFQTAGLVPAPASGVVNEVDLSSSPVGRWELAQLASVGSNTLTMTEPLLYSYAAGVSQVIRVPEYTSVLVEASGSIVAEEWNGSSGGVVAFLVQGTLTNQGRIDADGRGFRGGSYVADTPGRTGCTGVDEAATGGAQKGEGVASTRYGPTHTGLGNVANGSGGGVCLKAGGAGGSSVARGGPGGYSHNTLDGARPVGGIPGAAIRFYLPEERLIFGGGGGSAHGTNTPGSSGGGNGGGVVMIRASDMAGSGVVSARGAAGGNSYSGDGGGGGGAGGVVFLRLVGTASCASLSVRGGDGGEAWASPAYVGPGGGGGAGLVRLQSTGGSCPIELLPGLPGVVQDNLAPGGRSNGADIGRVGFQSLNNKAYRVPSVPTITAPTSGSFSSSPTPIVRGRGDPLTRVVAFVDGIESGSAVPDGSGNYEMFVNRDLSDGVYQLQVAGELEGAWSARSSPAVTFTVDTRAPEPPVITSPSQPYTNDTTPTVTGTAEPGSTVRISIDSVLVDSLRADPTTGAWSITLSLAPGGYTFRARAVDAAGLESTDTAIGLIIDLTPPPAPVVIRPVQGQLSRNPTLTIDGTTEAYSTVTVFIDGAEVGSVTETQGGPSWSYTFTSPPDTDRTYALQVRARDQAGNTGALSATRNFRIDSVVPDTLFAARPDRYTRERSAYFEFQSNEPADNIFQYSCNLDGAGFRTCSRALYFDDLQDGEHTLEVKARDLAGNEDATPAVHTWRVDNTPPETTATPRQQEVTCETTARFDFVSEDVSGVSFECSLDGAAFAACPTPPVFSNLGTGPHTLQVRAKDGAGNADATPVSISWTIDPTRDTDRDGLTDCDPNEREPNNPDRDGDGLLDGDEVQRGSDPDDEDSDGQGTKTDGQEVAQGTDPTNPDDDYEVGGMTCASAGAAPVLTPLALLLLGWPRRRRQPLQAGGRSSGALCAGLLLLVGGGAAAPVQAQGIDVQQYKPGPGARDVFGVYGPAKQTKQPAIAPHLGLSLNYSNNVLGIRDPATDNVVHRIITDQFTADALASVAFLESLELGLALPVTFQSGPDANSFNSFFPGTGAGVGLGNLRLVPKWSPLAADDGLSLGLVMPVSLPTSGGQGFLGSAGIGVQPMVLAQWRNEKLGWRVLVNAGVRLQPEVQIRNLRAGNEFTYALGLHVPFSNEQNALAVRASVEGALGLSRPSLVQSPLEARVALHMPVSLPVPGHVSGQLGGGGGFTKGYGTPGFRGLGSISWEPESEYCVRVEDRPKQDEDGDKILNEADRCPCVKEDGNGYRPLDGCPEESVPAFLQPISQVVALGAQGQALCAADAATPGTAPGALAAQQSLFNGLFQPSSKGKDSDQDGVIDALDYCPEQKEDQDGHEDEDGCLQGLANDDDNDKDGLPDVKDKCPDEAEVKNGYEDGDGCWDDAQAQITLLERGADKGKTFVEEQFRVDGKLSFKVSVRSGRVVAVAIDESSVATLEGALRSLMRLLEVYNDGETLYARDHRLRKGHLTGLRLVVDEPAYRRQETRQELGKAVMATLSKVDSKLSEKMLRLETPEKGKPVGTGGVRLYFIVRRELGNPDAAKVCEQPVVAMLWPDCIGAKSGPTEQAHPLPAPRGIRNSYWVVAAGAERCTMSLADDSLVWLAPGSKVRLEWATKCDKVNLNELQGWLEFEDKQYWLGNKEGQRRLQMAPQSALPAPRVERPSHGKLTATAVLSWTPREQTNSEYQVELARDADFVKDLVLSARRSSTSAPIKELLGDKAIKGSKWFWRVIPIDKQGAAGESSKVFSFEVE